MNKIAMILGILTLSLCTACSDSDTVSSVSESINVSLDAKNISNLNNNNDTLSTDNIVDIDWEHNKVYQWKNYMETDKHPSIDDSELKLKLTDFPDTVFIWRGYNIFSYVNGEEHTLVSGMPLLNAFFTDLNSDGFPELCTTVYMGSGIIDEHIVVYDYHNDKSYILSDRMVFDYSLYLENDELCVKRSPYPANEKSKVNIGKLAIENEELVIKQ